MEERWLRGIFACGLSAEATSVRHALGQRGLRCRSVPSGRALSAWTCATDRGVVAIVVSGRGISAAGRAADFWMPRAPAVLCVGAATPTAATADGAIVIDGDEQLGAAVASAARRLGVTVAPGRVATVSETPVTETALLSLAAAGYAAIDGEGAAWHDAARKSGAVMVSCQGVVDEPQGAAAVAPAWGRATRSPWVEALRLLSPPRRAAMRRGDATIAAAAAVAARCAVTALIGS
ncbi:MAG TPA: hypothetical protein VG266_09740 [Candidatus Dormibacteraeota bacterium]|nr:hypothetical protein [Candidatus Dormibacteraeota bacterium]